MGGTGRAKRRKRIELHGTGLEDDSVGKPTGVGKRDRARRRRLAYEAENSNKPKESDIALQSFLKTKNQPSGEKKGTLAEKKRNLKKSKASEFFSSSEEEDAAEGEGDKVPEQLFEDSSNKEVGADVSVPEPTSQSRKKMKLENGEKVIASPVDDDESEGDEEESAADEEDAMDEDTNSVDMDEEPAPVYNKKSKRGNASGLEDGLLRRKQNDGDAGSRIGGKEKSEASINAVDNGEGLGGDEDEEVSESGDDSDSDSEMLDPLEEESRRIELAKEREAADAAAELEEEVARNEGEEEFRLDPGTWGEEAKTRADGTEILRLNERRA